MSPSLKSLKTASLIAFTTALAFAAPFAGTASAQGDGLPATSFEIIEGRTALVITDPQNDFLSLNGVAWGVVGKNVEANGMVKHIDYTEIVVKSIKASSK